MRSPDDLSRMARLAEIWLGQREPDSVKIKLPIPLPDLDESEKEIVLQYWFGIKKLVDTQSLELQDALNGHPHHLENAFLCLLEQKDALKYPTKFLIKALQFGWKPKRFRSFKDAKKAIPWL